MVGLVLTQPTPIKDFIQNELNQWLRNNKRF